MEASVQSAAKLRAIADRQSGLVVMAATASFIGPVIAPALHAVAERFPGIAVRLIEVDEVEDVLLEGGEN